MSGRTMLAALLLGASVAACDKRADDDEKKGPFLEVKWTGAADSGKVSGPAVAEWCDSLRMLEIRAVRGDTGISIALYPQAAFKAQGYPVVTSALADSAPPAAAVALRWFAETSIRGFQGDSGIVAVQESPAGVYAGSVSAHAHSVTDGNKITIKGSFSRLSVHPATRGCGARKASPDSTPGVD